MQKNRCRGDRRPWLSPHFDWENMAPVRGIALLAAVLFALFASGAARADAIDGTWCSPDGRVVSIEGPQITTPGRHKVTGIYGRHTFSYVVPDGENPAGATVEMLLLNEDTVEVKATDREIETWRRCEVIS